MNPSKTSTAMTSENFASLQRVLLQFTREFVSAKLSNLLPPIIAVLAFFAVRQQLFLRCFSPKNTQITRCWEPNDLFSARGRHGRTRQCGKKKKIWCDFISRYDTQNDVKHFITKWSHYLICIIVQITRAHFAIGRHGWKRACHVKKLLVVQ